MNSDLVYSQQWNMRLRDNYPQAIDLVAHCIEELIQDSGIPREKIIGVCLGMARLIEADAWRFMRNSSVEVSPISIFWWKLLDVASASAS